MKQLVCEMCGSTDLIKQDSVFVCQSCGCKYSVEEAKKMMVEGTVEVTGTVTVDRSSEAENIIKNADSTYGDGNYKEAFDLYSQAMNIDPNNAHAVLYRAISSAWESSIKDCRIIEVNNASKRAFKLKHSQVGDSKEYFLFANDALGEISKVINAVSKMYERFYFNGPIGSLSLLEQKKQTLHKGATNCSVISSNIVAFMLDPVSDYIKSFDDVWNSLEIMIRNAKTYRSNAGVEPDSRLDHQLEDIQRLRMEQRVARHSAYWAEHAEEKAQLEQELHSLQAQRDSKAAEIENLSETKLLAELKESVEKLTKEKNSLGMFKGKEKKELQEKIDQLSAKITDTEKARQESQKPLDDALEPINQRISEIENELNRNQ